VPTKKKQAQNLITRSAPEREKKKARVERPGRVFAPSRRKGVPLIKGRNCAKLGKTG